MADQSDILEGITDEADVTQLTAQATLLTGAMLKLYQSSFMPGQSNVIADFTAAEADFNGYAAVALTWSPVAIGVDGNFVIESNRAFFQATDALAPNQIGGCWVETAGGDLIGFFQFDPPVNMTLALQYLATIVKVRFRGQTSADINY